MRRRQFDDGQDTDHDEHDDGVDVEVLRGAGADTTDEAVVLRALHVGDGPQPVRVEVAVRRRGAGLFAFIPPSCPRAGLHGYDH